MSEAPRPLPKRSFGPGGITTKNVWEFEGWIGSVKQFTSTNGFQMGAVDIVDREPADIRRRRKQGPPIWVRTIAFEPMSEQLGDLREGDRVFLRGNFHNRKRGTKYGFLTKWVLCEARSVAGGDTHVINQWSFEGMIARDPRECANRHTEKGLVSVGIWQPGLRLNGGKSAPVIINPLAMAGVLGDQVMQFKKGDPVCVTGHFLCFVPKGATALIIDRIYPIEREWMERKTGARVAKVLTPGLAEGVLEL